jgi:hypothetical protein
VHEPGALLDTRTGERLGHHTGDASCGRHAVVRTGTELAPAFRALRHSAPEALECSWRAKATAIAAGRGAAQSPFRSGVESSRIKRDVTDRPRPPHLAALERALSRPGGPAAACHGEGRHEALDITDPVAKLKGRAGADACGRIGGEPAPAAGKFEPRRDATCAAVGELLVHGGEHATAAAEPLEVGDHAPGVAGEQVVDPRLAQLAQGDAPQLGDRAAREPVECGMVAQLRQPAGAAVKRGSESVAIPISQKGSDVKADRAGGRLLLVLTGARATAGSRLRSAVNGSGAVKATA